MIRSVPVTAAVRRVTITACVALAALAGSVGATVVGYGPAPRATVAAGSSADWPMFGYSGDNTRYSPLTQINASNVRRLGLAWTVAEGPRQSTWETDPIVVKGTMYLTTNTDQVLALNAATGKVLWRYTPAVNFYQAVADGGGGPPTNRGVTVANGTVYLLTFDDRLIALRAVTGAPIWSARVADPGMGYSESSLPTYWNGLLFVGSAEGDAGLRGFVAAFDATTGKQVWRFYTVPAPGHGWMPATGHHGGGDVWMPPTVDTGTGIVYVATGNPSPDLVNTVRPGCDPWTDATVALNARTGKLLWAHTQVCPDVWDYDSVQPPMLFYVTHNGKTIRAVGQGNKEGYYWIFDAATGALLARSPALSRQTIPRPFPNARGVTVCPGVVGGLEYSPVAYSPLTHAVYVPALDVCMIYATGPASVIARHPRGGVDYGGSISPSRLPRAGYMNAVDASSGRLLWQTRVPGPMVGGALATAGNLVFSGSDDGHFYAFDARTGTILWRANVGLGFGAAAIAYAVNGREYIAIATGGASGVAAFDGARTGGTFAVFTLGGAAVKPFPAVTAGPILTSGGLPSLSGLIRLNAYMYASAARKRLVLMVTAAATPANSGFNFDGYTRGQANFIIPVGWRVDLEFVNDSALPHSAAITSNLKAPPSVPTLSAGPVETRDPTAGSPSNVIQVLSFRAQPAGSYYLVCLVPGHLQTGMWDRLTISTTAGMPSIQTALPGT